MMSDGRLRPRVGGPLRKNVWTFSTTGRSPPRPSESPPCTTYNVGELKGSSKYERMRGFRIHVDHGARDDVQSNRRSPTRRAAAESPVRAVSRTSAPREASPSSHASGHRATNRGLGKGCSFGKAERQLASGPYSTAAETPPPGYYDASPDLVGVSKRVRPLPTFSRQERFAPLPGHSDHTSSEHLGPGYYGEGASVGQVSRGVTIGRRLPGPSSRSVTPGPGDYDLPPVLGPRGTGLSMNAAVFLASRIAHDPTMRDPSFLADIEHIATMAQAIGRNQLLARLS